MSSIEPSTPAQLRDIHTLLPAGHRLRLVPERGRLVWCLDDAQGTYASGELLDASDLSAVRWEVERALATLTIGPAPLFAPDLRPAALSEAEAADAGPLLPFESELAVPAPLAAGTSVTVSMPSAVRWEIGQSVARALPYVAIVVAAAACGWLIGLLAAGGS